MNVSIKPPDPNAPAVQAPPIAPEAKAALIERRAAPPYPPKIAKAILRITEQVGPIAKTGRNVADEYDFQKWEVVLGKMAPLLDKEGLIVQQSELSRDLLDDGKFLSITYEFTIVNDDGDVWPDRPHRTALAYLYDDAGDPDDKAANKCGTQAYKYFLIQFFKLRTPDAAALDADASRPARPARARPKPPNPNEPEQQSAPHRIPTAGVTFVEFAHTFQKAVLSATTLAEAEEWDRLNDGALNELQSGDPDVFEAMATRIDAHFVALGAPAPEAENKSDRPKPPNPNAVTSEESNPVHDPNTPAFMQRSATSHAVEAQRKSLFDAVMAEIPTLITMLEALNWAKRNADEGRLETLTKDQRKAVDLAFYKRQQELNGA